MSSSMAFPVLVSYGEHESRVYAIGPDGASRPVCRVQRALGPSRLTSTCSHAICEAVSERLPGWDGADRGLVDVWVASDGALVSQAGRVGDLPITDTGNDGRKELVVLPWQGPRWGVGPSGA